MAQGRTRIIAVLDSTGATTGTPRTGLDVVTLDEAKNYLRVDTTTDDNLITDQINTAVEICENYLSRDILPKQREQYIQEDRSNGRFDLFYTPVASVDSVSIAGETQTLNEGYEILGPINEPVVSIENFFAYPGFSSFALDSASNEINITYTTAGLLNDPIVKNGVLAALAWIYEGRTDTPKSNYRAYLAPRKKLYI